MWTDERIEVLKQMWGEGSPASVIAPAIGTTRNAVIGKAHRIGLPKRGKGKGAGRPRARDLRYAPGGSRYVPKRARTPAQPRPKRELPKEPDMLMLNLLQLDETNCRFPLGDPTEKGFGFCGADSPAGHPYCEFHMRLAYQADTKLSASNQRRAAAWIGGR